ncbi:hypothetical protein ES695_02005 [Candidatus Atribacteria bacterium 1244-E10-H5-B2]|nr:MAG: hypothetical protein ES695_02005 [Candidatus Atribacteria bacterium 1244-E10-H5-B2]
MWTLLIILLIVIGLGFYLRKNLGK